jgi:hypothetical protein
MTRKPIQLLYIPEDDNTHSKFLALCDDGTIWDKNSPNGIGWVKLDNVPQPTQPDTTRAKLKNKPCQECGGLIVSRAFNKSTCVNGHEFLTDLADIPTSEVLLNAAKWTLGKHPSQRKPK